MKKILIFLLLLTTPCYAQLIGISKTKVLTKVERTLLKKNLKGKIFDSLTPVKNDYVDFNDRGTVKWDGRKGKDFAGRNRLLVRNYARHKVTIPNGTIIENANFSQKNPDTVAIRGKNLTFKNCNLTNVKIDPTWTLINTSHATVRTSLQNVVGLTYKVTEIRRRGKTTFEEVSREEVDPSTTLDR